MMKPMTYVAAALGAATIVLAGAAFAKPSVNVNCGAGKSIQSAVDSAKPGDTIFIFGGTCTEDVTITTDDITLSGNKMGNACDKVDPSLSADATIDGTIIADSVRVTIEHLVITGSGEGVRIENRADARLTCNDISDNAKSGVVVWRSSNAILVNNTLSGNGTRETNPFIFFDVGLYVLDTSTVRSDGNTYKENQYSAIDVERRSTFRNGTFLPREPGHAPVPGEMDTIIQKGSDPANPASCKTDASGPVAIGIFNSGSVDLRNADVCGFVDSNINGFFRIDDAGGEIIGNVSASRGSYVRIRDRSGFGDGRLTTFDGTLSCFSNSGTSGSNVQCGQTCSGAIPGTCTPP